MKKDNQNLNKFTSDFIVSSRGQLDYPGMNTLIPNANGSITMKEVKQNVLGIDDLGNKKIMKPGKKYQFPGNSVYEIPLKKKGGEFKKGLVSNPKKTKKSLASKKYSRSLSATNVLFTENSLFKKPKSRKNKVYNPKAKYYAEGGSLLTKKVTCKKCGWKWDAEDGGKDITTCHKCGGQGLIHAKDGGENEKLGCPEGMVWSKKDKKCVNLPVFNNSLNSEPFIKSTNLNNALDIKPFDPYSDFGKEKPKKIPIIEDSFLETLEKDINDFLENPLKTAAQVSESLKEKGEDPSDALRHSTAGALTAQTIANKTGNIPFISNPLGYLGANIAGIGHELSTLSQAYLDDRPWSVKLQESLEDIYNNSAGANTIFSNKSEKDKINYLLKLTRENKLPDGYGEERPFRDNPKWTDPYNQKQYGGINKFDDGGTTYTVKGSKGVYKKINGKWQVDWNRSGKYQPLSKGDVKARTAVLDKMAKPVDDGISKISSNSSDNTRVNYQKPLVESFNRSNNLESFYKKEREKDLQKQKDATAYHDKTQKVKQIQSFGEFINQDVRGIPTYKQHMAQIANDKKLLKKELKPYFETEKEIDQFLAEQSRPSAENNYHDGPIQMVYPEKYFIGPGGGMIGNIKNFGKNTFNLGKKVLSNPYVSGGLNAYFAAEGIKEFSDPNSLTRKSMSRAYDDPTGSNIGDAAWDVGMNSLNFVGLPFGKAIKDSKNLINDTYNAGKGSNIFFNFSNEANAARKLQNIGLLKKNIDPKIFGKYPNLAQNVTKRLLKDYNTTYRAVYPNVKKMGFEDMVNMAKSGYDINDPMQVVEYMTTTIPISNTGAYRAGLDLHSSQDALYTGKFKTPKEAFEKLDFYGNYIAAVRPKMDFSKGTLNEWIDQYYTNKLFALNKNPNKGFFALRNPKAYESGSLFKPGAIGFTREHDFWPYIGNKGEKVLEHVKTYNLNQKQKGGITNDYVELDLTPKEVKRYKERGYIVEEIN